MDSSSSEHQNSRHFKMSNDLLSHRTYRPQKMEEFLEVGCFDSSERPFEADLAVIEIEYVFNSFHFKKL